MKILLFTDSLGAGGAQRQLCGLSALLKSEGHQVTVVTYYNYDFYSSALAKEDIRHVLLKEGDNFIFRISSFISFVLSHKPDILIAYQETPSLIACFAKLFKPNMNIIVSERNSLSTFSLKHRLRYNIFRLANHVVTNSFTQENFIKRYAPFLKNKLKTIINFVDLKQFYPSAISIRKRNTIIIPATIRSQKNIHSVILASAILKEKGYPFEVLCYGKSDNHLDYFNYCQDLIKDCNLENTFHLLDKTDSISHEYQKAYLMCLPSLSEGTPNAICEAFATGLPVVCSDVCDNSRYVIEGENGFLFKPNSPADIATAVEKIISLSADEYVLLSCNARHSAEQHFSSNVFLKRYSNLF